MNDIQSGTFQTPIERALGVDENGMTTSRKLYEFLELNPGNYARWCKTNITENEFAEESIDYYSSSMKSEGKGNFAEDYKLTAHFAKKLCVKGNGAKAEQAREYFTGLEERVKQKVVDYSNLSPELQRAYALIESQARIEIEQKRQAEQLNRIEQKQETIVQTFSLETTKDTAQWVTNCLNRIAESPNFTFAFGNRFAAAKNESYQRLTAKAGCRLDQKLRNAIERANEKGYTKAQLAGITKFTVIMADKRLKEIYAGVIKEMMIAYCVDMPKGELNYGE